MELTSKTKSLGVKLRVFKFRQELNSQKLKIC